MTLYTLTYVCMCFKICDSGTLKRVFRRSGGSKSARDEEKWDTMTITHTFKL